MAPYYSPPFGSGDRHLLSPECIPPGFETRRTRKKTIKQNVQKFNSPPNNTVDGSEIGIHQFIGSLSHYLQGFTKPLGFSSPFPTMVFSSDFVGGFRSDDAAGILMSWLMKESPPKKPGGGNNPLKYGCFPI